MEMLEIVLLFAGGIIFILSFFIPEKKREAAGQAGAATREEISELVSRELQSVRSHVDDVVEESITYAMEKTERALERLSNEKIMAVSEYSDTVLAEIHKNHEEAMFLYDMLNSKHVNLKNTVSEVNRTVKEAEETVTSFKKLAPEAVKQEARPVQQVVVMSALDRLRRNGSEDADKAQRELISGKAADPVGEDASEAGEDAFGAGVQQMYGAAGAVQAEGAAGEQEALDGMGLPEDSGLEGRNSNEQILELYAQGKSKVEIAKELGLGVGEVRLVIDLYRNQRK